MNTHKHRHGYPQKQTHTSCIVETILNLTQALRLTTHIKNTYTLALLAVDDYAGIGSMINTLSPHLKIRFQAFLSYQSHAYV